MKNFLVIVVLMLLVGCSSKNKTEEEIKKIPINVELLEFDTIFGEAKPSDLSTLKKKYPLFFPKQYPDSIWIQKMQDTLQQQLYAEVVKKYKDKRKLKREIKSLFQHIKYYFPSFKTPLLITTTSDVDYRDKIILADTLLIVKLDTYLGSDHFFYEGISKYISQNMKESQILSDIASVYAQKYIPKIHSRSFLAQMIYYGRLLYLKDLWLPESSDAHKIGYTEEQITWAKDNEIEIWRNFVEKEYLFNTNPKLSQRFIVPAPFSKFYLDIDNESPGMIGRYMGWQIVRSFMRNNNNDLHQLLTLPEEEIFKKSKYKPKK